MDKKNYEFLDCEYIFARLPQDEIKTSYFSDFSFFNWIVSLNVIRAHILQKKPKHTNKTYKTFVYKAYK